MDVLVFLIPASLALGAAGLAAFVWALRNRQFDDPEGVAVDGNRYFFSDSDNNRIVRYSVVLN